MAVHVTSQRPAGEKIDALLLQLASTGGEQREPEFPIFDKPEHLMKQDGQTRHLVEHDSRAGRDYAEFIGEKFGMREERLVHRFVQQIAWAA